MNTSQSVFDDWWMFWILIKKTCFYFELHHTEDGVYEYLDTIMPDWSTNSYLYSHDGLMI